MSGKALKCIAGMHHMPDPEIRFVQTGEKPRLKTAPHLVCGFPGSGFVGKLAVDHLIEELKAIRLVDIYSSSFPPQVMIGTDGTVDLMKNSIFWWEGDDASLLLLTGDTQPQNPDSEYALASQVLDFASGLGMNNVFTLAAYITGVFVEKPRVFGTATDSKTVATFAQNNISTMDSGSITGMNGLIIGIAKMRGLKGVCLLGETSGYVVDAKASKTVLETLLKMINIKVDMANLDKRAKDTEMLIQTIEQQMSGRGRSAVEGSQRPQNTGYIS